jgi:polyphosphate kinase
VAKAAKRGMCHNQWMAASVAPSIPEDAKFYLNRELSLLSFFRRVLEEAQDGRNPATAQTYTDLGLFTCDEDMGADATDLFNYLTGYSAKKDYRKFLVAPINLRSGFESLIRREMERQQGGEQGYIFFGIVSQWTDWHGREATPSAP